MSHHFQYLNLKKQVLEEAGSSFSLEQFKQHFSSHINSRRALSRVKTLACIILLLEERDILSWNNVECFRQLGNLLQKDKIGELVQSYKKLYLDEIEELCVCGVLTKLLSDSSPVSQLQKKLCIPNINPVTPDITQALKNISQRVGNKWPYLARALGIRECHIDHICALYPNDFESQAREALHLWHTRERENASLEILDRALNARHCVRFGLGSFLRETTEFCPSSTY